MFPDRGPGPAEPLLHPAAGVRCALLFSQFAKGGVPLISRWSEEISGGFRVLFCSFDLWYLEPSSNPVGSSSSQQPLSNWTPGPKATPWLGFSCRSLIPKPRKTIFGHLGKRWFVTMWPIILHLLLLFHDDGLLPRMNVSWRHVAHTKSAGSTTAACSAMAGHAWGPAVLGAVL